jgi:hypothetical protein
MNLGETCQALGERLAGFSRFVSLSYTRLEESERSRGEGTRRPNQSVHCFLRFGHVAWFRVHRTSSLFSLVIIEIIGLFSIELFSPPLAGGTEIQDSSEPRQIEAKGNLVRLSPLS